MPIAGKALSDPKEFYDARYNAGYMTDFSDLFEACRVITVRQVIGWLKAEGLSPRKVFDYGCGEGRYFDVLGEEFPQAKLFGCDISQRGIEIASELHPGATLRVMEDETIPFDERFDLAISVEVLEHVQDVRKAVAEISRVLAPGGRLLVTTPCANRYSLEWFQNRLRGGLEPSHDGFGRFATDEPGHLRRLTDRHLVELFARHDVRIEKIYHRAHGFTTLAHHLRRQRRPGLERARLQLAMIDWKLFKHLPNGATMLALGRKLS